MQVGKKGWKYRYVILKGRTVDYYDGQEKVRLEKNIYIYISK
jgi:hypothetical protein